jgi:tetratricopeptide (TPR) repeat protein
VWSACKAAGELCNLLAMTYLQKEDYGMVGELLKKAEILTERDPAGRAVTFNNLACFCRQQGRLHASLTYLQRALAIEQRLTHVDNPADTHLNLCAVLSQLGRHDEALQHSQAALQLLQDELFGGPGGAAAAAQKPDRIAVLAIAYHNLGVEHEFLLQFTASLKAYTKGVEIASVYLGADHGITATLRSSQLGAARSIEEAKKREQLKADERQRKIEAASTKAKVSMGRR